jgi:hypothetical protein
MGAVHSLKILGIGGRTDSSGSAQNDVDQEELRLPIGALLRPGILPNLTDGTPNRNAFRVRQDTGANMNVKIGSGTTKVDGIVLRGTVAGQGSYIVRLDATTVTKTAPAADATNPKRYGVYVFVNDAAYSGTASRAYAEFEVLAGTAAPSPTTPGPRAEWSAYELLWEFQLAALATAVTDAILDNSNAIDQRQHADLAVQNVLESQIFT